MSRGAASRGAEPTGVRKRTPHLTAMCLDVGDIHVEKRLPKGRSQLTQGERDPGSRHESGDVGGGRELLEGSKPGHHGAVWAAGAGWHKKHHSLGQGLDCF